MQRLIKVKTTVPRYLNVRPRVIVPKVTLAEAQLVETSYLVGKGITLFTMFYCTLNWLFYRDLTSKTKDKHKH